jgi:hypothetical protein
MPKAALTGLAFSLTVLIVCVPFAAAQQSAGSQASWAGWARLRDQSEWPGLQRSADAHLGARWRQSNR